MNTTTPPPIAIVECPRDAMQGWPHFIATSDKIRYLNSLLKVGFHTVDFGSFVSPKAIPQMMDTKEVLEHLDLSATHTQLLAIVANRRGAEEAVAYNEIAYLGFPFSISPTFQQRNANSSIEKSLQLVDYLQELCTTHNKKLVIYLSMAFGNPYGDPYNEDILTDYAGTMVGKAVSIISLADTVGLATPGQITAALQALVPHYPNTTFGVHLHTEAANSLQKLEAALDAGCSRIDGALKGIGGCPMAQNELVGNMPTELVINQLEKAGLASGCNHRALANSMRIASEIFV